MEVYMAKKRDSVENKVSTILDSYVKFKDMDEEEFRATFGGAKATVINSWLYLLYLDLKDQYEPDESEEDNEDVAPKEPPKTTRKKRSRKKSSKSDSTSDDSETNAEGPNDEGDEVKTFGLN